MKSHHQDRLIEIQFTRPAHLSAFRTPRIGSPAVLQTNACLARAVLSPHGVLGSWCCKVTLKKLGWWERSEGGNPAGNWSISGQFSLPFLWAQRCTLVDMLWSDVWQPQNNAPAPMPHTKTTEGETTICGLQKWFVFFLLKWASYRYDCDIKTIWPLSGTNGIYSFPIWKTHSIVNVSPARTQTAHLCSGVIHPHRWAVSTALSGSTLHWL